jgi:hypothetical protein
MNGVRSGKRADRPLEVADQGREQSRPTGSLRPPAAAAPPEVRRINRTVYTVGSSHSTLATSHCFCTSTRFCPKSRTRTKQTTKPCLPGSRFAHPRPRTSIANALSNRELRLLERTLTHRKQTIAPRPNREHSTNPCFRDSVLHSLSPSHSFTLTQEGPATSHRPVLTGLPRAFFAKSSVWRRPFLTGSASQTESFVTRSKQSTAPFLTGARTAIKESANPHFLAPQDLMLHRRPIQIFLRPTI